MAYPGTILILLGILASAALLAHCACPGEYRCINFDVDICVSNSSVRDGQTHCPDNSDEDPKDCGPGGINSTFVCDGTCSVGSFRWDGFSHCKNDVDEIKYLGEFCDDAHTNFLCNRWTNDSVCVSGKCQCKTGWREIDFRTCQRRVLEDPCGVSTDCSAVITNSLCRNGKCLCLDGSYEDGGDCTFRKIGDNCTVILDCSAAVTNSFCSATTTPSTCLCNSGYLVNGALTTCTLRRIGDPCTTKSDCEDAVPLSDCSGGNCVCPIGYKGSTSCSPRIVGDTCASDTDCSTISNSICSGGRCACKAGHEENTAKTACTRRTVGSSCTSNVQCTAALNNSACINQTCHCITDYVSILSGSQCRQLNPNIRIGDVCYEDIECNHVITNSVCSDGKCACISGYYPPSSTQCIPGCATDAACQSLITNSKCINFACNCEAGTRRVTSINTCMKNELSDTCSQSLDCALIGNAVCLGGVCVCANGHYESGGTQCVRFKIGDKCTKPTDCTAVMPGLNCTSKGICECDVGYRILADSTGCSKIKLGDNCTSSTSCAASVGGSGCVGGKCQCLPSYDENSLGQCEPKKLYSTCSQPSDCVGSNLQCLNGVCVCQQGYQPDAKNTTCYTVNLGDKCADSSNCTKFVENSVCGEGGTCVCAEGYRQDQSICIALPIPPPCDFLCLYPWLIPVVAVLGIILTVVGIVILYFVCKYKKGKIRPKAKKDKTKNKPYVMRPPSRQQALYDLDGGGGPEDNTSLDITGLAFMNDKYLLVPPISHTFDLERSDSILSTKKSKHRIGSASVFPQVYATNPPRSAELKKELSTVA